MKTYCRACHFTQKDAERNRMRNSIHALCMRIPNKVIANITYIINDFSKILQHHRNAGFVNDKAQTKRIALAVNEQFKSTGKKKLSSSIKLTDRKTHYR